MGKKCLKCGYERTEADYAPDYECPSCGAVYAKVEKLARERRATVSRAGKFDRKYRSKWTILFFRAIGIFAMLLILGGLYLRNDKRDFNPEAHRVSRVNKNGSEQNNVTNDVLSIRHDKTIQDRLSESTIIKSIRFADAVSETSKKLIMTQIELANNGNASAQNRVGAMYYEGKGLSQDYKEAAKWFLRAAEQGDVQSQSYVAAMYYRGEGFPQDYKEAAKWFLRAAEQGRASAQNKVGAMYYEGEGFPQDYKEAAKWFLRAAEQGNVQSQRNAGAMYFNGQGVSKNYEEAAKWFLRAAEQNEVDAQFLLGIMYVNGEGVPQDYEVAATWFVRAAEQGHKEAKKLADLLVKKINSDNREAARQKVLLELLRGYPAGQKGIDEKRQDIRNAISQRQALGIPNDDLYRELSALEKIELESKYRRFIRQFDRNLKNR